MAKQPLKRSAPKPTAKLPSKPASKVAARPLAKAAAVKSTKGKTVVAKASSKVVSKPAASKPLAKKAAPAIAKPINGTAAAKPSPAKPVAKSAPAAAKTPTPATSGKSPPAVTTKAAKSASPTKAVNGAPVVAPAPVKNPDGRPMLMQGPVASKALSKKGTFVLSKTPVIAPKPLKRKIDRPEPEFVTLQPPVAQVKTSEKAVKNRAGLNQKDLDFFRDLLLQKRRELVGDMSHMEREALRENNASINTVPVDPTDQGTDAYEQEFTLGLVEKDRTLLREINDAMAKLQNGTYGICEGTGNPIGRPRLEAQPWARHSIEFARILEKRKMVFRR